MALARESATRVGEGHGTASLAVGTPPPLEGEGSAASRDCGVAKPGEGSGSRLTPAPYSAATRFGITTRIPRVPSIYIGSADVIPLEMVGAYGTIANDGLARTPRMVTRIETAGDRRAPDTAWGEGAFVAATDTFARGWMQVFSDVARRHGVYILNVRTAAGRAAQVLFQPCTPL